MKIIKTHVSVDKKGPNIEDGYEELGEGIELFAAEEEEETFCNLVSVVKSEDLIEEENIRRDFCE
ncbi:hypothetical protein Avbf_12459 [Armadillidium vulgare]|nr:hypothetical protein Avbf_12459 [Armadillidium vulgare]